MLTREGGFFLCSRDFSRQGKSWILLQYLTKITHEGTAKPHSEITH